jgi:hypothetical protein
LRKNSTWTCSPSSFLRLALSEVCLRNVAVRKYVEAPGRHYNGFLIADFAARTAASTYDPSNRTNASAAHSLIGTRTPAPVLTKKSARRIVRLAEYFKASKLALNEERGTRKAIGATAEGRRMFETAHLVCLRGGSGDDRFLSAKA